MNAQDVILGSRVAHLRELKAEVAKLKAENDRLRSENAELLRHFDMALAAAMDLDGRRTGMFIVVDGWNLILGAGKEARSPEELEGRMRAHLEANPDDFVWIVYDGEREGSRNEGRLRVSWTGGKGPQRADRFICDFLRMARLRGDAPRIVVKTHDKELLRNAARILG